jgi:2-oxoglutarate ferredoxin oxidoreductase subunit beta
VSRGRSSWAVVGAVPGVGNVGAEEPTRVGRALDSDRKEFTEVLGGAAAQRGSALVEIFQDCPIFNDGSFDIPRKPETKELRLVPIRHDEPIRFRARRR